MAGGAATEPPTSSPNLLLQLGMHLLHHLAHQLLPNHLPLKHPSRGPQFLSFLLHLNTQWLINHLSNKLFHLVAPTRL